MTLGPLRFTNALGGTADFIYPGPSIDMQSPAAAGAVDGTTYLYYAQSFDMSQWEIGKGAYTASSKTFARTTITANSSGTTAKINFADPPQIFIFDLQADTNTAAIAAMQAAWTAFTPTISSAGGTLTSASASGRYKQIGKTIFFSITGVITTNGAGSSWLRFTPPVAPLSTGNFSFNAYNVTDNILLMGRFIAGASNIDVFKIDGTYPGADGKTYIVSGSYEAN